MSQLAAMVPHLWLGLNLGSAVWELHFETFWPMKQHLKGTCRYSLRFQVRLVLLCAAELAVGWEAPFKMQVRVHAFKCSAYVR